MVIHQFNRLIRNKWVWGVFAVAISAAFALDFLAPDIRKSSSGATENEFAGKPLNRELFEHLQREASLAAAGRLTGADVPYDVATNYAWNTMAQLETAKLDGITATDAEVRSMLAAQGFTDRETYNRYLATIGASASQYEMFLRHALIARKLENLAASAAIPSAPETLRAIQDWTSDVAVREITFTNKFKDVKADFPAFYAANTNSLVLPERRRARWIFVDAMTKDRLAAAEKLVTEDDVAGYYSEHKDEKFVTHPTPTQTVYKAVDEVRGEITAALAAEGALRALREELDNGTLELYGVVPEAGKPTYLDQVAKANKAKPAFSPWVASSQCAGFVATRSELSKAFPGASGAAETIMQLPADAGECAEFPYCAIVGGTNGVYLVEATWIADSAAREASRLPSCEEAAKIEEFKKLADVDARNSAFRKYIEEREAGLAAELAKIPLDTTNKRAVAGATLSPVRRYCMIEARAGAMKRLAEIDEQDMRARSMAESREQLENQLMWSNYMRNQISSNLRRDAGLLKLSPGAFSKPEWQRNGDVKYTIMVARERNGAREADENLRREIAAMLEHDIASFIVPAWARANLAAYKPEEPAAPADGDSSADPQEQPAAAESKE